MRTKTQPFHFANRVPTAGVTLVEIVVALTILAVSMGGVFAALMQSRRLTEGSVVQNSAITIVQGYVEQMKNMGLAQLINGGDPTKVDATPDHNPTMGAANYSIQTQLADNVFDLLKTSTGTPPALNTLTPGTTPINLGIADNLKSFDVAKDATDTTNDTTDSGTAATYLVNWTAMWPGAIDYSNATSNGVVSTTTGRTDLHLNIWVWVKDLTGATAMANRVYGITVIYTWQYIDGGKVKYVIGTVRSIRSAVPTM